MLELKRALEKNGTYTQLSEALGEMEEGQVAELLEKLSYFESEFTFDSSSENDPEQTRERKAEFDRLFAERTKETEAEFNTLRREKGYVQDPKDILTNPIRYVGYYEGVCSLLKDIRERR